jgi:hypothetical protein
MVPWGVGRLAALPPTLICASAQGAAITLASNVDAISRSVFISACEEKLFVAEGKRRPI